MLRAISATLVAIFFGIGVVAEYSRGVLARRRFLPTGEEEGCQRSARQ